MRRDRIGASLDTIRHARYANRMRVDSAGDAAIHSSAARDGVRGQIGNALGDGEDAGRADNADYCHWRLIHRHIQFEGVRRARQDIEFIQVHVESVEPKRTTEECYYRIESRRISGRAYRGNLIQGAVGDLL